VRKKAELPTLEKVLHDRGLMEWDVDFSADDWHPISSERVVELALKRIEERGRGILLLHDIHQHTVDALPVLQRELKARGYRIVEVVPAGPDRPATPSDPEAWTFKPRQSVAPTPQVDEIRSRKPVPAEMFRASTAPDRSAMPAINETMRRPSGSNIRNIAREQKSNHCCSEWTGILRQ
jgi:hypothetical protein